MKKNYVPSSLLALLLLVVAWKSAKVAAVTAFSVANVAAPNSLGIPVYPYMNNGGNVLTWYVPNAAASYPWISQGSFQAHTAGHLPTFYDVPSSGIYHFDAQVLVTVLTTGGGTPNQNIDLRLVTTCNTTTSPYSCDCSGGGTLQQGAAMFLTNAMSNQQLPNPQDGGFLPGAPNYSMTLTWTGYLTAKTLVGLCLDNWMLPPYLLELSCFNPQNCNFSGFLV